MKIMEEVKRKRTRVTEGMPEDPLIAKSDHEDDSIKAAGGLINQVFNNYVLTDCVFEILPISDILSCSSVSKTWNTVSREFLRRKRTCLLTCHLQDLEGLDNQLKLLQNDILNNHPFKGVKLCIGNIYHYKERHAGVQLDIQEILTLVLPKYLTISFEDTKDLWSVRNWFLRFVRAWQSTDQIEYLRVVGRVLIAWSNLNELPKLKSFQSDYVPPYWGKDYHQHFPFIRRCPALTDYIAAVHPAVLKLFHKNNKLQVVRWIHLFTGDAIDDEILERMEELAVPVQILSLEYSQMAMDTNQRNCVTRLLSICRNTLRKVILLDFDGPLRLQDVTIPPMTTISEVVVENEMSSNPSYYDLVNDVALRHIFPNARITPNFINNPGRSSIVASSNEEEDNDSSN